METHERLSDDHLLCDMAGPQLAKKLNLASAHDFTYETRTHPLGAMPATGGDIFVHAKSNVYVESAGLVYLPVRCWMCCSVCRLIPLDVFALLGFACRVLNDMAHCI